MIIIPAIDIKDGKCVRLAQGRMDAVTVYSEDPSSVALKWAEGGAELIHVVDLDGAIEGNAKNLGVVKEIVAAAPVPVQIGGGIRNLKTAETYLSLDGVKRVIIGTAAYEDPALLAVLVKDYPGRIAVGIDAKDGRVAIKGWVDVTDQTAMELAKRLEGSGVGCIIYTDISRDGMLTGPNVEATSAIAAAVTIPVIASGGVSSIKDIESYRGTELEGIIIGKALYSGDIDLKDAISTTSAM